MFKIKQHISGIAIENDPLEEFWSEQLIEKKF